MSLTSLYEEMNVFLADSHVLAMKIHNVHWNVKGRSFFTLHEKMDEYYDLYQTYIDEVAERLLAIGGQPVGSYEKMLKLSAIKELDDKKINGVALVEVLEADFASVRKSALRLVKLAEDAEDVGTADLFTGIVIEVEKQLWMLQSYLEAID